MQIRTALLQIIGIIISPIRAHQGWHTYKRGRTRVNEALYEATLTELELRRKLAQRGLSQRVIHGVLSHRITERNPCCC